MEKRSLCLFYIMLWTGILFAQQNDIVINEFMASNSTILLDEDGEYSDWIELYNTGTQAIDLGGWYISDNPGTPTKWQFPSIIIPSGGYLVIFASGKDHFGSELHTNFSLKSSGEYLGLFQSDGVTVVDE